MLPTDIFLRAEKVFCSVFVRLAFVPRVDAFLHEKAAAACELLWCYGSR
jgi:hypothetical protein